MTFEDLLQWPDRIDQLTDAQLEALVAPFFPLSRPRNKIPIDAGTAGFDPKVAADLERIKATLPSFKSLMTRLKHDTNPPERK